MNWCHMFQATGITAYRCRSGFPGASPGVFAPAAAEVVSFLGAARSRRKARGERTLESPGAQSVAPRRMLRRR